MSIRRHPTAFRLSRLVVAIAATLFGAAAGVAQTTTSTSTTTESSSSTTTLAPPTTHLKCYRTRDPLRVKGPRPSWLELAGPQVSTEQCMIVGSFRLVCVPVTEMVTQPIERSIGPGAFAPFTPVPLANEEAVSQDRICYRIKCTEPSVPDPATLFTDEFGSRTVTKTKPYVVCAPATKMLCGDGVVDPGEQCDDGNTTGGDCCSATCQFEGDGAACHDSDPNDCVVAQCDGAGTCDQQHAFTAAGTACPDTDNNGCTVAQCDGAGTCKQDNAFTTAGTVCPDTDGNSCTLAQCDGAGVCKQNNAFATAGTVCPDTDGNSCTAAQCNGAGVCNQNVLKVAGTSCPDSDGNQCTRPACNGTGTCVQDFFVRNCTLPTTCNPSNGQCE